MSVNLKYDVNIYGYLPG